MRCVPTCTEPGKIIDQLLFGQGARNINRPDVDLGAAALLQNAMDPTLVCEGVRRRRGGNLRRARRLDPSGTFCASDLFVTSRSPHRAWLWCL
jgi:hypothetical protein